MPLQVVESVSFDALWRSFGSFLSAPGTHPLRPGLVVVPGAGWERWLTRGLIAEQGSRGAVAGYDFVSLGGWVQRLIAASTRSATGEGQRLRDADWLRWAIAARLPELMKGEAFEAVAGYIRSEDANGAEADESAQERRLQLAEALAGRLDDALLLRPDLIRAWRAGDAWPIAAQGGLTRTEAEQCPWWKHVGWQQQLFAAIDQTARLQSAVESVSAIETWLDTPAGRASVPERIAVWITANLPPAHRRFLDRLGRQRDVQLLVLNPSDTYWADMQGRAAALRQLSREGTSLRRFCREHHVELLHPLLAAWGGVARQRQIVLLEGEAESWMIQDAEEFDDGSLDESTSATLLGRLQTEIRAAAEPEVDERFEADPSIDRVADRSLRIHRCASHQREVQVLKDQLLEAFDTLDDLRPEEVIVLCPDLETYAPLVQATLETGRDDGLALPVRLAGRSPRKTRPMVRAMFAWLDTLGGRFESTSVLDLLAEPPVAAAAGLTPALVKTIAGWVVDAGISWGAGPEHRVAQGQPNRDMHTWRFGLDRLLMGMMMPAGAMQVVDVNDDADQGIVTLDRVEGMGAESLGKLASFVGRLDSARLQSTAARTADGWRDWLVALVDDMVDREFDPAGVQRVLDSADRIASDAQDAGFVEPMSLRLWQRSLQASVDRVAGGSAFGLGGITVCEPGAVRSLPYRVVAWLGLHDGAFPGQDTAPSFDLIAADPRPGDRSRRLEDKQLFLESLLATKDRFLATFMGRTLHDDRERPPSIVIQELLDAALDLLQRSGDATSADDLIVEHPMQAFSPDAFEDTNQSANQSTDQSTSSVERFSFDTEAAAAAARLVEAVEAKPRFVEVLPEASNESDRPLDPRELITVATQPWRLIPDRLGLRTFDDAVTLRDEAPLLLDTLEAWQVGDQLVQRLMYGESEGELVNVYARSGQLPDGDLGAQKLRDLVDTARAVVDRVRNVGEAPLDAARMEHHGIDVLIDGRAVTGTIAGVAPVADGSESFHIYEGSYSNLGVDRLVALRVKQALLTMETGASIGAYLGARDKAAALATLSPREATVWLKLLLEWRDVGRRTCLPLFRTAGRSLAKADRLGQLPDPAWLDEPGPAIAKVAKAFRDDYNRTPESQDPLIGIVFAGVDPFDLGVTDLESSGLHLPSTAQSGERLTLRLMTDLWLPVLEAATLVEGGAS